jgi:hypothetical protein
MKYMLMIYGDEAARAKVPAAAMQEVLGAYRAYTEALRSAGALVAGDRLADTHSATVVRVRDGKRQVQDGPFAEAKEQLGGYYLIEAKDLDEAIAWAARCPGAAHGGIEVRPLHAMQG